MEPLFCFSGTVITGKQRGRHIGFPTANLAVFSPEDFSQGIYAGVVIFEGKKYKSSIYLGSATTFKDKEIRLECYLHDFSGDLYGKNIDVQLWQFIRPSKNFKSVEKLMLAIQKDTEETERIIKL